MRGYFVELRKARAPVSEDFSHASDDSVVAGAYLWATLQSHCMSDEFTSQNWREHVSIAIKINYHILK